MVTLGVAPGLVLSICNERRKESEPARGRDQLVLHRAERLRGASHVALRPVRRFTGYPETLLARHPARR